jgi:hypothetical protein
VVGRQAHTNHGKPAEQRDHRQQERRVAPGQEQEDNEERKLGVSESYRVLILSGTRFGELGPYVLGPSVGVAAVRSRR